MLRSSRKKSQGRPSEQSIHSNISNDPISLPELDLDNNNGDLGELALSIIGSDDAEHVNDATTTIPAAIASNTETLPVSGGPAFY